MRTPAQDALPNLRLHTSGQAVVSTTRHQSRVQLGGSIHSRRAGAASRDRPAAYPPRRTAHGIRVGCSPRGAHASKSSSSPAARRSEPRLSRPLPAPMAASTRGRRAREVRVQGCMFGGNSPRCHPTSTGRQGDQFGGGIGSTISAEDRERLYISFAEKGRPAAQFTETGSYDGAKGSTSPETIPMCSSHLGTSLHYAPGSWRRAFDRPGRCPHRSMESSTANCGFHTGGNHCLCGVLAVAPRVTRVSRGIRR